MDDQPVSRRLFGTVDKEANQRFVQEHQEMVKTQMQEKYNFDFETEAPLPGKYKWTPIGDNEEVPIAYKQMGGESSATLSPKCQPKSSSPQPSTSARSSSEVVITKSPEDGQNKSEKTATDEATLDVQKREAGSEEESKQEQTIPHLKRPRQTELSAFYPVKKARHDVTTKSDEDSASDDSSKESSASQNTESTVDEESSSQEAISGY